MSIEKFKNEANEMQIPKKDFRNKVDKIVEETIENNEVEVTTLGLNLFEMEAKEAVKKTGMTIYFEEDDLRLLKAISKLKNTTVNKTVMNILETTINTTKANLPSGFDIEEMANQYDEKNKDKGRKKVVKKPRKTKSKEKSE
ncbi:MAG: hypothetical protein IJ094_11300 [Bacilli bacterium]|nr:hypothetical protein [Bacilli bacterium]